MLEGPHPDILYRDRVLRAYVMGKRWNLVGEFALLRKLIAAPPKGLHEAVPCLYDHEWEVEPGRSQSGKGDIVMTNGTGTYAVVEVKWLNMDASGRTARSRRTRKRSQVEEQAIRYAREFFKSHPEATVVAPLVFTDEVQEGQLKLLTDFVLRRNR